MAVLRCGRARFAHGDRSEAAAVVPLDMPNFLRSGKNLFPRNYIYRYKFSREMIVDWYCLKERERGKIGGPGTIIQVDESKFGRRKYNRGRRIDWHWVLGLIENNSEDFRLIVCPNNIRDAATLIHIIKEHVQEGSEIRTDAWRAYSTLNQNGYTHNIVNHSDPENRFICTSL